MKTRGRIFICYRREGGADMARLVHDNLRERGFDVFMDVEDLKSGQFNKALLNEIEAATDVIPILSPGSLDRCFQDGDWLRWEIGHAIACEKNIVPLLTRGFTWPSRPLPEDLKDLPSYQGVEPSHSLFKASMDKLVSLLKARPALAKNKWANLLRKIALAAAVIGGVAFWLSSKQKATDVASDEPTLEKPDQQGWVRLFDGKTLKGWTAPNVGIWEVKDGVVIGQGKNTHLFSPNTYTNLEFKSEAMLSHNGNSGVFIRARLGKGIPEGYRAQINNTARGSRERTGSLRIGGGHASQTLNRVTEQLVADDAWFTQHIIAISNHIIIKVNDKIVTDFIDPNNTYTSGRLALQQLDLSTVVRFRNTMVKRLSDNEKEAWAIAKKDMPEIKQ